jgi:hypothetical protein
LILAGLIQADHLIRIWIDEFLLPRKLQHALWA